MGGFKARSQVTRQGLRLPLEGISGFQSKFPLAHQQRECIVTKHDMSLLTSNHLSPAQRRIAWAIAEGEAAGRPALVPDLVQALGYGAESSISATLRIMERNGFLEIVGGGT